MLERGRGRPKKLMGKTITRVRGQWIGYKQDIWYDVMVWFDPFSQTHLVG